MLQRLHRTVNRDQRAGTGGVHRLARTAEVKPVRHAVGQHGLRVAQGCLRTRLTGIANQAHVLVRLRTGPHAYRASCESRGTNACVFKRRPDMLQEHPVLRVHEHRFARRHAEECTVEMADIRHEAAPARNRLVVFLSGAGLIRTPIPAFGRNFSHTIVPGCQVFPQCSRIGRLRKATADADNRYRLKRKGYIVLDRRGWYGRCDCCD